MPRAEIDGLEIYYEEHGAGEPVVLLNGILMSTQAWVLQRRVLATRYRCVLHDFRGQLQSARPDGPYRMEQHAHDLAALLDHLGIERAHVIGTSYGGEVGMIFAYTYPERVRSLAVIASVSHVEPLLRQQVAVWAETARRDPGRLYDVVAADSFSSGFLAAHPEALEQGRERLRGYDPAFFRAFAGLVDAFAALEIRERLAEIAAPTLVLCGEEDALKPVAYSRRIAQEIPEAEFFVIPAAGHAVVIEHAEAVNAALLGFLARHRQDRAGEPSS